jgi:hypothetical protein
MNVEIDKDHIPYENPTNNQAEDSFHMAFGWLVALSVMIANVALGTIS